ncbi:Major facilitator super domain-containing protein 1 [Allomyces arbusculus]|nr:Major facilitator super domain-containing protein 1 [Allomyces arbusculus]
MGKKGVLRVDYAQYAPVPAANGGHDHDSASLTSSSSSSRGPRMPQDDQERLTDLQRCAQQRRENAPLAWKLFAFGCTLLLGFGSHYSAHVLSALKSTLKADLGINNAQYGVLQAAVSLVNTIVPAIGGRFIDVFGVSNGSIVSCTLIMTGGLLVALSTHWQSFAVMVLGRILYGLGSMTIITVQHTILAHWFRGSALAIVVGVQIATSRLASFLAMLVTVPIKNVTGWYGYSIWTAFALCLVSWLVDVVYVLGMRRFRDETRAQNAAGAADGDAGIYDDEELAALKRKNQFQLDSVYTFPPAFWVVAWLSFAMGSTWTSFLHISPELIADRFHQPETLAAFNASLGQFLPIIVAPFLGYFLDARGQRPLITLLAAVALLAAFLLLWITNWPPYVALVLFSLSLTFGPVAMVSSVGLLIGPEAIGTALGIYKTMTNVASTIMDPVLGWLQDQAGSYDPPLVLLIVVSVAGIVLAVVMGVLDKVYSRGILAADAERRKVLLAQERDRGTHEVDERTALLRDSSDVRAHSPVPDIENAVTPASRKPPPPPPPSSSTCPPGGCLECQQAGALTESSAGVRPTPTASARRTDAAARSSPSPRPSTPVAVVGTARQRWWGRFNLGVMTALMVLGWVVFIALFDQSA